MIRFIGVFIIGLITASFLSFDRVQEVQKIFWQACAKPVSYRVGSIDPSFGLSEDKLRAALLDAEKLWEVNERDLFVYSETGDIVINFIYDARQQSTSIERELRRLIGDKRSEVTNVQQNHSLLSAKYEEALAEYEIRLNEYERNLAEYNTVTEEWNQKGGAPTNIYKELVEQRVALEEESDAIRLLLDDLNEAVAIINGTAEDANISADEYNTIAAQYNEYFHEGRSFTQGDYQQREINIYQYDNGEELRIVLAHELGHALGLGHVEGGSSIMNAFTEAQSLTQGLSVEDISHLADVCNFSK